MGNKGSTHPYKYLYGKIGEKKMLDKCPGSLIIFVHTWKCFVDDILIIWTGSEDEFRESVKASRTLTQGFDQVFDQGFEQELPKCVLKIKPDFDQL